MDYLIKNYIEYFYFNRKLYSFADVKIVVYAVMHKFCEKISKAELRFIREHAPRGLWKMVQLKTGKTRSQVDYQLRLHPEKRDPVIIGTARELLEATTGLRYRSESGSHGS